MGKVFFVILGAAFCAVAVVGAYRLIKEMLRKK